MQKKLKYVTMINDVNSKNLYLVNMYKFVVKFCIYVTLNERYEMMKIWYYTFGCKVNQYETENIKESFHSRGCEDAENFSDAQVCIVNTCTVTAQSDSKCRQLIHKIKKENPECVLVLAGCFPQAFAEKAGEMTECDIIVGTGNKNEIPSLTEEFIENRKRIVKINPREKGEKFEPMTNSGEETRTRAYIKIQDGCDQYCTYCIIPFARGHICSKPLGEIKEEVKRLVETGHKEIILTGINLCCYGRDFRNGTRLIDAIETACGEDGDYRVRLSSVEPELISDDDIARMSLQKKLCPHFHLSLQSGCDKTLKAMNRHYNCEQYRILCGKLRENFPDCAITTDIMVGFPDETQQDFEESLKFAEEIAFADAHIFPYSRRSGTIADKMDGQIDKKTKHSRAVKMAEICSQSRKKYLSGFVGKEMRVLFEKENSPLWHQGHTGNYIPVRVKRENPLMSLRRRFETVKITNSDGEYCYGEIIR